MTGAREYTEAEITPLGEQCSMTERRADDATREVADWLKCEYMQDHLGAEFDGVVSTVTSFGLFVRLTELYIEGLVHVTSLQNDYYHFDAERHTLSGEHGKVTYRMGDLLKVKVAAVNLEARKIDLVLVGEPRRIVSKEQIKASKQGAAKGGKRATGKAASAPAKAGEAKPKGARNITARKKPRRKAK